jgi:hypothetical protein
MATFCAFPLDNVDIGADGSPWKARSESTEGPDTPRTAAMCRR